MRREGAFLVLLLAAGATPAAATQLITNGGFTALTNGLGQITDGAGVTGAVGWSTPGYNSVLSLADQAVDTVYGTANLALWDQANGGSNTWNGLAPVGNILALDGDYQTAAVTQTVSGLTVGGAYALTFSYAFSQQYGFSGPTVQNLTAGVGSASWTSADYSLPDHGFSGWRNGSLSFTATSTSETVSFLAYGDQPTPPFALVSGVSLNAVPEPSTWAMMLAGFAGLGFAGFRSTRRKAEAPA